MTRVQTSLGNTIDASDGIARLDEVAKKLIRHRIILAEILKGCTEEFRDLDVAYIEHHCIVGDVQVSKVAVDQDVLDSDATLVGANTEDASHDEGKAFYDFVFDAQVPDTDELVRLTINLEVQVVANPGYPLIARAIYYLCRLISRQKGTVFQKDEYGKIRKVYSIWICPDPKKQNRNSIAEYGFMQQKVVGHVDEPRKNYDKMKAIIISLNDDGMDSSTGIIKLLSALLSTTETVERRKGIVEGEFGIPLSYEITEEMKRMCNLGEAVAAMGMEMGMEKGVEKGIVIGAEKNLLANLRSLMETLGFTAEQAMDALKVPAGERRKYADML